MISLLVATNSVGYLILLAGEGDRIMALRGTSVRRREAAPLLRGEGTFVADFEFDNPAYVHYLTST